MEKFGKSRNLEFACFIIDKFIVFVKLVAKIRVVVQEILRILHHNHSYHLLMGTLKVYVICTSL